MEGEVGGRDREWRAGWDRGCGTAGTVWWVSGRTSDGAEGSVGASLPAVVEIVFRNGLGVGGIEPGALVEAVGVRFLSDIFIFPTAEFRGE
jgi:hypothetical protein